MGGDTVIDGVDKFTAAITNTLPWPPNLLAGLQWGEVERKGGGSVKEVTSF